MKLTRKIEEIGGEMRRRSRFAIAAEAWFKERGKTDPVTTREFWDGLSQASPELTNASQTRKTPKATCMRDLRKDGGFIVGGGLVGLRSADDQT